VRDIDDWVFHFERKATPRLKEIFEKELDGTPEKMIEQLQRLRLVEEENEKMSQSGIGRSLVENGRRS
jgi:hypothetical protein